MSCNTLQEILKSCDGNVGGIVKFYINNADAIDKSTVTIVNGVVTAAGLDALASEFVEFQFNPNTSNFTENSAINLQNGSTYYEPIITLQLARREAVKRQKLLLIADGQPKLTIIVKDSNSKFWLFGYGDDNMYLTGNEGGSGQAKGDFNGYTLTFSAGEGGGTAQPAYEIQEAVVDALTTGLSS
jgi:hypothetical protein